MIRTTTSRSAGKFGNIDPHATPFVWTLWIPRRGVSRLCTGLLILSAAVGVAWAADSVRSDLKICTLQQCFSDGAEKSRHECANGCYFEEDPVDVSPEAVCEVMAQADHEGSFSYMYRDTVGKVTVGIGNMLPDADAAAELPFIIIEDGAARAATEQEIRDAFSGLPPQPADCNGSTEEGRQNCRGASSYESANRLRLSDETVNSLCQLRLANEFLPGLTEYFPDYGSYPSRVKAAMLDIIYNVGVGGFSAMKWPSFHDAAAARDWQEAADESRRGEVQASRNAYVKEFLEEAARQEDRANQRLAQCSGGGIF